MPDLLAIVALGFVLGMRHATDADHVVAVTTIVTRQRTVVAAAATGLLWGVGHTLTVFAVGAAIVLFNVAIPYRVGIGMEMSVGVMLILLGAINVAAFFNVRPRVWWSAAHADGQTLGQALGQASGLAFGQALGLTRPLVVGIVHGLAGSAAVALLVVAAVRDPKWAIAYLLVFGAGTIAGMMLITMSLASALHLSGVRSEKTSRRLAFACGLASIVFGASFAWQVWSAAAPLSSFPAP